MRRIMIIFMVICLLLSGSQAFAALVDNGDGTVTDTHTRLMWQRRTPSRMNWENALSYCDNLVLAGYSNWHLPNLSELKSMDIDRTVFYDTVSCFCWSSTPYANDVNSAWGRHCGQYYTQNLYKGDNHCVRAVRSVSSSQSNLPLPVGQFAWNYLPVEHPIKQTNPADCKPFAIGDLSTGNLNLQVGLPAFSSGVDIYLAIGFADALFLVDGSNVLHSASGLSVLPKWRTNVSTAIDESLYGDISTSLLPPGGYNLYALVVPTGETDFSNYYFWATSFNIGD